jgi:ACS family pantothenate transporter-like MFS transporter
MTGWYLNYFGSVATMILCAWALTYFQGEPGVLTILFASGTVLAYLQSAFVPLAAYPTSQAPVWKIGAKSYLGFDGVALCFYVGIHYGFKWKEKKTKRRDIASVREESEPVEGEKSW